MKFTGPNGRRPSTEARKYIYRVLAVTLKGDLSNGSGFIFDDPDLDESDLRRVKKAVYKVIREMERKAT